MAAVALFGLGDMRLSNLAPPRGLTPGGVISGALRVYPAFGGVELCAFAAGYLDKPLKSWRASAGSVIFASFLIWLGAAAVNARFGGDIGWMEYPAVKLVDASVFPIAERLTAFLATFWIFSLFSAVSAGFFFFGEAAAVFGVRRGRAIASAGLACALFSALPALPEAAETAFAWAGPALPALYYLSKMRRKNAD
jgi:L-asparagine transporter-like permease